MVVGRAKLSRKRRCDRFFVQLHFSARQRGGIAASGELPALNGRGDRALSATRSVFFSFPRGKRATEFYLSSGWYIRALGDILRGAQERERRSERKREGGGSRERRRSVGCICTPRFISLARRTLARSLTLVCRANRKCFLSFSHPLSRCHVYFIRE